MAFIRVIATTKLDLYSFVLPISREYVILMRWYIVDMSKYIVKYLFCFAFNYCLTDELICHDNLFIGKKNIIFILGIEKILRIIVL